jgi:hypothetical protein
MAKKKVKTYWELQAEEQQKRVESIKPRDRRAENIAIAERALAAAEERLSHLKGVQRRRNRPLKRAPVDGLGKPMVEILAEAQQAVDRARQNLAMAKKPPQKRDEEAEILATLERLDKQERKSGRRGGRSRSIRKNLEARLDRLWG